MTAGGVSGTTDAEGRFSLQLTPGSYTANVSAHGWQSGNRTVQVNDGYSSDINFYLTAPAPCTLQGVARSVTVCAPVNGTTVKSPVHLAAATSEAVLRMEVWADGSKLGEAPGNVIDTNFSLGSGQHNVSVTAVEVDTSLFTGQVNFNIDPPPPPPSDFVVSASPANQSIKHGQSATYAVSVAAQNGAFNGAVALSCSGLPKGMSCSFAPGTVTPGATTGSATLTVSASASSAASAAIPLFRVFAVGYALLLPLAGVLLGTRGRKIGHKSGVLVLLLAAGMALQGCGGGGGSQLVSSQSGASVTPVPPESGGGPPPPVATTSTLTIVATSGATVHSTTITLTVQ